ncbi:MAG: phenylalanine--tRNA ligase subunit beta, partial [Clostridia bacterium]
SPQLCPNYNMQVVTDVKVERSPLWLTRRLNAVGLRGNNNIIDITNYVLMEIGQPMHAFDQKDIRDNTIIVRRAEENEKITPFDKKEYTLNSDVLVIADKNRAVGIAGIMGGVNSGIKNDTTTVAFESAKFLKENIRRTSRLLNLRSDSSARYEKGVDAYTAKFALNRALHLIEELKCGKIVSGKIEIGEETHKRTIEFPLSRIEWLLGIVVPNDEIVKILTNLHINTTINNGNLICGIPEYREDLEQDCDIIEEIIRVYGYDNIIPTLLKKASITKGGETEKQKRTHRMKALFVGEGYQEISTYSFGGNSMYEKLNLDENSLLNNRIKLKNALGEEFSIMRTTLIGNMLNIIQSNLNKKNSDLKLFEYGRCYYPKQLPLLELPDEVNMLSIGLCGKKYDFYTIMEMIKLMLNEFNIKYTIVRSSVSYLHPGVSADIYVDDFKLGYVGKLHPSVKSNFNIDKEVYVAELNFDAISNHSKLYEKYIPFGRYPTSTRDLALIIDNNILSDDIKNCIANISDLIMNVELFDVYNNIGLIGKKSYAYSITFGCSDRTLKDSEVDSCVAEILETLENKFDAKIRS